MEHMKPTPQVRKYFTPGVIGIAIIAVAGILFVLARLIFGIGAVTNLNNQYPWGIWITVDLFLIPVAGAAFTAIRSNAAGTSERRIARISEPPA